MDQTAASPAPLTPGFRIVITVMVMSAVIMYVLDVTIANVALPHMQSSLGASQDTITWVLTSYIIAGAIATPLTGWLTGRFGQRAVFIAAVLGFTVSSAACGLAPSLSGVVAARAVQGAFGAFITPMSQAILLDIYPKEKHSTAMTIWGMGAMIGPIMGPMLGGWLTDQLDWRWVFFINVPIGTVLIVALVALLPGSKRELRPFDVTGFVLLGVALASMQLILDRGTQLDWYESPEIILETGLLIATIWMYGVHTVTSPHPLIPLALFRNRNFMLASFFLLVITGLSTGIMAAIALFLQQMLKYGPIEAGLLTVPRAISMMLSMLIAGRLSGRVDGRLVIAVGMALVVIAQQMMTGLSLGMDEKPIIITGFIQGLGFGLMVMPLSLIAFATLPPILRTEAAAFYSLARTLGGSIMISALTALIARNLQVSHADLSAHVSTYSFPFLDTGLVERFGLRGAAVAQMVDAEINRQALMISYLDMFWATMIAAAIILPLLVLLRGGRPNPGEPAVLAIE